MTSSTATMSASQSVGCGSSSSGTLGLKRWPSVSQSPFAILIPSSGWSRVGGDNIFGQRRIGQVSKGKGKSFLQRARRTVQSWKAGNLQQGTHVDHPRRGYEGEQGEEHSLPRSLSELKPTEGKV